MTLGMTMIFLDTTQKVWSIKEIIDKLDYNKIKKKFYSVKDNVKKMRRQATEWEITSAKDTSNKELLSKIYKFLKPNNKKTNIWSIKKWTRDLTKEDIQMANKYMKWCKLKQ